MSGDRLFVSVSKAISQFAGTLYRDERSFEGEWWTPNVPLLIFADSALAANTVPYQGGKVGSGLPVQLIFWGAWWNTPEGRERQLMIRDRVQRMIDSPYFSQLAQYKVSPPRYRGSIVVTKPAPPTLFASEDDTSAVPDLIDDLIDDSVFPDPDDEQIAHIVLMPSGFAETIKMNGSHKWDYNYEFPFDKDWYWVAWVRYWGPGSEPSDEDPENTIRSLSHELVELLTDPEGDGWLIPKATVDEIADTAWSSSKTVRQAAWVNGARVSAYWSNVHKATVIPIDRDYRARIAGEIEIETRHELDKGSFRPEPHDRVMCGYVDVCCIQDRDYTWVLSGRDEIARLELETHRYVDPVATWIINGVAAVGATTIEVPVHLARFKGRTLEAADETVPIFIEADDTTLTIRTSDTNANFDLDVACTVRDRSITGNLKTDVLSHPSATVGFIGVELLLDADYERQRAACNAWLSKTFTDIKHKKRLSFPKPGEPVEIDPGLIALLPAWTRSIASARVRLAILLIDMAQMILPGEVAGAFAAVLLRDTPELALLLAPSERRPG